MTPHRSRIIVAAGSIAAFCTAIGSADSPPKSYASYLGRPIVTTIAPIGIPSQSFAPVAIAIDRRLSRTLVADRGGQRIWAIDAKGRATVIAGPTFTDAAERDRAGDFADGPSHAARFNEPGGIALRADGALLVADTKNDCIRLIARAVVTTFAGKCRAAGAVDGDLRSARFTEPRGLALGSDGTLYVADGDNGIRMISNGVVTTLAISTKTSSHVSDLSILEPGDPKDLTWIFYTTPDGFGRFNSISKQTEGFARIGPTSGIVALGPERVVVAKPDRDAIYFVSFGMITRAIAGTDLRPENTVPGKRDGYAPDARFNDPQGLAMSADGTFLVADSGNRSIRRLPALNLRWVVTEPTQTPPPSLPGIYHVVYVSNSLAYYNTMWDDSVEGRTESFLNAHRPELKIDKPVRVDGIRLGGSTLKAQGQYIREILGAGNIDLVIWNLDGLMFTTSASIDYAELPVLTPEHRTEWAAEIADTKKELDAQRTQLLMIDQPMTMFAGPGEGFMLADETAILGSRPEAIAMRSPEHGYAFHIGLEQLLEDLPVDSFPTYERYLAYERGAHLPLFGSNDFHPTPLGNAFHAQLIIEALLKFKPWQR